MYTEYLPYSHREGGKSWTREKVRGATVHKAESKIPTWLIVTPVYKICIKDPLQVNFFRWRHFALVSIKLISLWWRGYEEGGRLISSPFCQNAMCVCVGGRGAVFLIPFTARTWLAKIAAFRGQALFHPTESGRKYLFDKFIRQQMHNSLDERLSSTVYSVSHCKLFYSITGLRHVYTNNCWKKLSKFGTKFHILPKFSHMQKVFIYGELQYGIQKLLFSFQHQLCVGLEVQYYI